MCLGHELHFFWWQAKSYANFPFYTFCPCHRKGSGMLWGLDAFMPKIIMSWLIFMWRGIIHASRCKALYREGLGSQKEERDRSIKTGGFVYPVTVLLDLVALLSNPQGKWACTGGRSPIHSPCASLQGVIAERPLNSWNQNGKEANTSILEE